MYLFFYLLIGVFVLYKLFQHSGSCSKSQIEKLVRQTARWATAAQQDKSPLISVLHANYAAGYLWALKDVATTKQIHNATGVNVKKFEEHILNVQDSTTQRVLKICPEFSGEVDLYLSTIAGESTT
jgi:hypothetical protein